MLLRPYLGLGHARAALTLAVLLAACGGTTANDNPRAGSAGNGATAGSAGSDASAGGAGSGASAGSAGTAAGGSAGGGRSAFGSSGTTGVAGAGESGGGAAGRDQGTGGTTENLCPGSRLDPARATTPRCHTVADCQSAMPAISSPRCQTTPPTYQCGGPAPIHECDADPTCGTGRVCNLTGCGYSMCADACPTKACASYEDCTNGHCAAKPCDAAGALSCGSGTQCKASSGGTATCQAIACNAGFVCPATWDCAPGPKADAHGCVQRACNSAADCACGYCVNALCEATPGYCFSYAPPP